MTAKNDIFEGLHVLLVTEDDTRAHALAKALRDRKANVGDVKAGARDPVALRGADLIMVDARSEGTTRSRLADMRADVRARWASVVTLDFGKLVLDDGAIYLSALEEAILPHIAADKALSERARKEGVFETTLAPLGPSRTLRALALAGPTLHLTLTQGELQATVCLANELLVCAFVERGTERYEAWAALARVLGLSDAKVTVEKRAHPTAMNIMEPINQALEVAAQERMSSVNLPAVEALPVAAGMGRKGVADDHADLPAVKPGSGGKRTLLGVAGPAPQPARPAARVNPVVVAPPKDLMARGLQNTMLGMPANAPRSPAGTPGPVARPIAPANDVSPPAPQAQAEAPRPKAKSRPELEPVALDEGFMPRAKALPDTPTREKSGVKFEPVPGPASRPRSREGLKAVELPEEQQQLVVARETFAEEATRPALQLADRMTLGDRPTDPTALAGPRPATPAAVHVEPPKPLAIKPPPAPQKPAAPRLESLQDMADAAASEQEPAAHYAPANLAAAIAEEVPDVPLADSAVQLVDPRVRKQIQEETLIIVRREQRRSRAAMLFVLFLFAVGNYFALRYMNEQNQTQGAITRSAPGEGAATPEKPPSAKPAKSAAPTPAPVAPAEAVAAAPVAAAPNEAAPAAAAPNAAAPVAAAPAEPAPTEASAAAAQPTPAEPAANADAESLLREGMKLLEAGQAAAARPYLERAVAADPKSAHGYSGLADAQLALKDASGALRSVEQAIRIRPKRSRYRVQQGDILKVQGKADEARAAYAKALEIDPNDREAKRRVGP